MEDITKVQRTNFSIDNLLAKADDDNTNHVNDDATSGEEEEEENNDNLEDDFDHENSVVDADVKVNTFGGSFLETGKSK